MLRDSVVVVVVVVRTRPRAIPLAMIAIRKILHGFPFPSRDAYGAPLGGPSGRRSSAITSSFVSLTEERFSEHQSSVAQNILLLKLDRDVMRSRSTAVILFDNRFSHE